MATITSFPLTTIPFTSLVREKLTANTTFYVRTDGSDSNDGLANTAGGAFLTLQYAYDYLCRNLDFAGYTVTFQIGDGTYTSGLTIVQSWWGGGQITIQGNTGDMNAVIISTTDENCITNYAPLIGFFVLDYLKFTTASFGSAIYNTGPGTIYVGRVNFGACANDHVVANERGACVQLLRPYTISGGAVRHLRAEISGFVFQDPDSVGAYTVTLSGTPAFSTAFAATRANGNIFSSSITFSGSATGSRYSAVLNGTIDSDGGGASYFPGNSVGSTATGGQYAA